MTEKINKRHFPPSVFGRPYRQECLKPGCDGILVIEGTDTLIPTVNTDPKWPYKWKMERRHDPGLREGQIWGCPKCLTPHEFYLEYATGETAGLSLRMGTVRVWLGNADRDKGEPTPGEFAE